MLIDMHTFSQRNCPRLIIVHWNWERKKKIKIEVRKEIGWCEKLKGKYKPQMKHRETMNEQGRECQNLKFESSA